MKTLADDRLSYRELARQQARIARTTLPGDLPRLAALVERLEAVDVQLHFYLDDEQRPWIAGTAQARTGMLCTRCAEVLDHSLSADFALCVVADEEQAGELASSFDVLVAAGEQLSVADIVEDELLLNIPERLCDDAACVRLPALSYPAEQADEAPAGNPFAVLADLKKQIT